MSDAESADRARRIDETIALVRGRAQTATGAVILETDPYGAITDLRIGADVIGADPSRLAAVIIELHRRASEEAVVKATDAFERAQDAPRPAASPTPPPPPEYAEAPAPVRFTYNL